MSLQVKCADILGNAEYEAVLSKLSHSQESKKGTATYPFIEGPNILTDNKGQALSCIKIPETRLKMH
jgi:hypothetical protein